MFFSATLSISALGVFATGKYSSLEEFSDGRHLYDHFHWPFYIRILAGLLTVMAAILSAAHEYRIRRGGYTMTDCDEEKVVVLPIHDEDDDDNVDDYPAYGDPL